MIRKLLVSGVAFGIMLGVLVVSNRTKEPHFPVPPPQNPLPQPPQLPQQHTLEQALQTIQRAEIEQWLRYLTSDGLEGRMSGMQGNRTAAEWIFKAYQTWGLQPQYQEFSIRSLNEHKEKSTGKTSNIVAVLPGNHPSIKDETLVVGAHMDHIGYGPSMSQSPNRREIHPGADDNASGTVALMGIAKAFSMLNGQNNRRIVFISFSAEEMGLIGAKYYVDRPVYPNTVFMLNMDMIGRNKGTLSCLGVGSSSEVKAICEKITKYPFRLNITSSSGGGSDHAPFYTKGIPICFLHTGMHAQYHTPDDKADLIDFEGLTQIARFVTQVVWEVDRLPTRPQFKGVVGQEIPFNDHDFEGKK